jgi:hypothetical protein
VATENFAPEAVRQIQPLEISNWDALLTRRPDFSFFHGSAWAKVLTETYGFTPFYLATGAADVSQSILPLMEVDSWLTGRRGVTLPFTDDCAPLAASPAGHEKLFQAALKIGRERRWKYVECRGGRKFFGAVPAANSYYGHNLELAADEDKLFGRLESSVRRAIRKSQKDGVTVEVLQSMKAVEVFYKLQCQTRKRHGLPPQPFDFFVNIHRHILSQNQGFIALASYRGQAIAASVYFFLGGRAIYKYGASDLAQQQLRANNSVMWEAIRWLARTGATRLHFGKTARANEGLRRFKLAWGTDEETIEYFKYDLRQNNFVTDADAVSGWHNTVFRSLPGFLSRAAGKVLYKHWA